MKIRSRNEKITGKRINSIVGKAMTVDSDYIPLEETSLVVDPDHVSAIRMGAKGNPAIGVGHEGSVWVRPLKGTFKPDEVGEVEIRDGKMCITMGKNQYWFAVYDPPANKAKIGEFLPAKAEFEIDPSKLAGMAKKAGYVRFEAGYNKDGKRTVFVAFYDDGGYFVGGLDLKTAWKGESSASMFPADRIARWDKLGKKAKVRMNDDYPIRLTGEDEGVRYEYVLAPRIESDGPEGPNRYADGYYGTQAERDWYASCNKKALPRNKKVVELDRQRILSIYGTPEKFRKEVDSVGTDAQSAIYTIFASCGDAYPRWMIGDYLSTALGPDYRSYGRDEYDLYGRLMARDGMEIYRQAKVGSANRKSKGKSKAKKG